MTPTMRGNYNFTNKASIKEELHEIDGKDVKEKLL